MANIEGGDAGVYGGKAVCLSVYQGIYGLCVCLCSAWSFIMQNFRKRGSLLVTVPSLQESLKTLQVKHTLLYAQQENIT